MSWLLRFTVLTLHLLFFMGSARADIPSGEAFYIEPMELHLDPRPPQSQPKSAALKIVNNEAYDSRVRLDTFERREGKDGSEERELTKDIRVDETAFVLKAGQSKTVMVHYQGLKRLSKERAYRIVVKQVETGAGQNAGRSLDLRFVYVASVYVTPAKAAPKLIVKDVRRTSERGLEVEFHNEGSAHQRMDVFTPQIEVATDGGVREVKLSPESRQLLAKQNFLPGVRRKILLEIDPAEKLTGVGPLNVRLIRGATTHP